MLMEEEVLGDIPVLCANGITIIKPSVNALLAIVMMIVVFQHSKKKWMLNILIIFV